jgi:predicted MFS family arabinose efflux permease
MKTNLKETIEDEISIVHQSSPIQLIGNIRMEYYLAFAYLCQGFSQQYGVIAQPIQYYLMKGLNWSAAQIAFYMSVMLIPWVIKPIFGLVCDFIPLYGWRKKSYLFLGNIIAAFAFVMLTFSNSFPLILTFLFVSAIGMSISVALLVGITVESGGKVSKTESYFSYQGFCYYAANLIAALIGGTICQHFIPLQAVNVSAMFALIMPFLFAFSVLFLIREKKLTNNIPNVKFAGNLLKQAFQSRSLQLVALFLWCFNFSPGFGIPLYFYESKQLGFSQEFIGQLGACNSFGMLLGALVFAKLIAKKIVLKNQLKFIVVFGTASTLSYLVLNSLSAPALEIARGITSMISILTLYSFASKSCPKYIEVSVMATMITIWNLALEFSTFLGGQLYSNVLQEQFSILIYISALTTALCFLLIPFMPTGKQN